MTTARARPIPILEAQAEGARCSPCRRPAAAARSARRTSAPGPGPDRRAPGPRCRSGSRDNSRSSRTYPPGRRAPRLPRPASAALRRPRRRQQRGPPGRRRPPPRRTRRRAAAPRRGPGTRQARGCRAEPGPFPARTGSPADRPRSRLRPPAARPRPPARPPHPPAAPDRRCGAGSAGYAMTPSPPRRAQRSGSHRRGHARSSRPGAGSEPASRSRRCRVRPRASVGTGRG